MAERYFTQAGFTYLRDLAAHNDREWFHARQAAYVDLIREPGTRLAADLSKRLAEISPRFGPARLIRIQRDIRFTADKTPYKAHTGVYARHADGVDVHAPGVYLRIEPGKCHLDVGMWRPPGPYATAVRAAIAADPDAWLDSTKSTPFTERFALDGTSLVRPPRGAEPDHPLIDDLKRRDFVASAPLAHKVVTSPGFLDAIVEDIWRSRPFLAFVGEAAGMGF